MAFYWYLRRFSYTDASYNIDLQRYNAEKFAEKYYPNSFNANIWLGTTGRPIRSLRHADFLRAGDVVGMTHVILLSTKPAEVAKTLTALHDKKVTVHILDIDYNDIFDEGNCVGHDYELLNRFLVYLATYEKMRKERRKNRTSPAPRKPGRPTKHYDDLSTTAKRIVQRFTEDDNYTWQNAQTDLAIYGVTAERSKIYTLRKEYLEEKNAKKV